MIAVSDEVTADTPKPPLATIVGLLLALLTSGVWLALAHAGTDDTTRSEAREGGGAAVRREETPVSDQEMFVRQRQGGSRTPAAPARIGHSGEPQTVYLVGSAEEGEQVWRGLHEADAIRAPLGGRPLTGTVMVIDAGRERGVPRALGDVAAIRDALRLPAIVVVDLRAP